MDNPSRDEMNQKFIETGRAIYKTLSNHASKFDDPGQFIFGSLCAALIMLGCDYLNSLNPESIDEYVEMIKINIKNNLTKLSQME